MSNINPVVEDYKRFLIFSQIGLKLLQELRVVLCKPPYSSYFKNVSTAEQHEIAFAYWGQHFKTRIELFFNNNKMPAVALIATYYLPEDPVKPMEEIISYPFDIAYNINHIYTADDFAEHYVIEFHENLKKSFSDNHAPFPIKMNSK